MKPASPRERRGPVLPRPGAADPRLDELRKADPNDPRIDVTSDQGDLGREGDATLTGNVTIRMGQRAAHARTRPHRRQPAQHRSVDGDVEYLDPQLHVKGSGGAFEGQGVGSFEGAEFELLDRSVPRRREGRATCTTDGKIDLKGVRYTACPPGNEDWKIAARRDLDRPEDAHRHGRATCGSTSWACRSSIRRGSRSRSATSASPGLLFPTFGSSSKSGTQVAVPWYWNIAPNYDATFTARWYSTRGFRIDPEFRYLTERSRGILEAEYLPSRRPDRRVAQLRRAAPRHALRFRDATASIDAAERERHQLLRGLRLRLRRHEHDVPRPHGGAAPRHRPLVAATRGRRTSR